MSEAAAMSKRESGIPAKPFITYDTDPDRYAHWKLSFDGPIATLKMDVDENRGISPGYKLKLNSYDLGVDIELSDALQRIRFEHPEVKSVIVTSGRERVFCSGANIFMLGLSTHAWKVNFCKFTNETRNGIEDSSAHSGLKFIAACNGTTAGGGYELALACDEIILIDDRSSAVSLPEVPLLGVLPGTGGLTRITDKRKVRRDQADIFCTLVEGVRAPRAKEWRLIDDHVKPQQFMQRVNSRALELAAKSDRPQDAEGIALTPLNRNVDDAGYRYEHVDVRIDRNARSATITVSAPLLRQPEDLDAMLALGASWWPLAMARELDDAILLLRTNELEIGTWLLKTQGDAALALAADATLRQNESNWFVRETIGMLRRTLARLDVTSRTLYALIEPGSCFAGTLCELALAADRSYMLALPENEAGAPHVSLSAMNFGAYPMVNGLSRIAARFYNDTALVARAKETEGRALSSRAALELGLVTAAPDDLDWAEEIRIALEERASLSPDALTGMEANLRFGVAETMETRVFGRLSTWQNWIFVRPNAVGESGALKLFGTGNKARFNWERV
jgi:benzoyl-CoA-dihydrodiol lyase